MEKARIIEAGSLLVVTDPELVIDSLAGDSGAFPELYARYRKRVASLVDGMMQRRGESEEVVQEVFLQMHLSLDHFEGRSSFHTWLTRLAMNVVLNHVRASRRRYRIASIDEGAGPGLVRSSWLSGSSPEQDATYNELQVETARVIEKLPVDLKRVMELGPIEGHSCDEVARILHIRPEVVKSRLHRARLSTRDSMWRVERRGVPDVISAGIRRSP